MQKLIIAHRGASAEAPENTLQAFQKAVDAGADMVETDIRRTKDGVLMLHHDPKIRGQAIDKLIWGQVKALDPRIPTLEEALRLVSGKIKLDAEIKEKGYEQETAKKILEYLAPADFLMTSSFKSVLRAVKSNFPQVRTGWIIGNRRWVTLSSFFSLILKAPGPETDFLVLNWMFYIFVLRLFCRTRKAYIFTTDNEGLAKRFLNDPQVAGVIMNDPRPGIKLKAKRQ